MFWVAPGGEAVDGGVGEEEGVGECAVAADEEEPDAERAGVGAAGVGERGGDLEALAPLDARRVDRDARDLQARAGPPPGR